VASGDPVADGVAVGDYVSVYADGSTVTGYVAQVTGRTTTTITMSATVKAGTAPTDGTSTRTLKVGGAWAGPSGTDWVPLSLATLYTLNSAGEVRVNLKDDATYSVTAGLSYSNNYTQIEGFTTSYGDGGRATISGGTNAIDVLTVTGASYNVLKNLIGVSTYTGASVNRFIILGSNGNIAIRCAASGFRWEGFATTANGIFLECEAYSCSAASARGGFVGGGTGSFIRCIAHDNSSFGFGISAFSTLIECIADTNSSDGFNIATSSFVLLKNCDAYNNTGDGFEINGGVTNFPVVLESCNAVKNGGWGINLTSDGRRGTMVSCAFGSGTQANTSGTTRNNGAIETDTITYAADVTPWVDPANGDFRISLTAAKGTGRGVFTQTAASYAGTVGYPDIGASQHADSGGGGVRMVNVRGGADQ
jgi:hypothetical protein